MLKVENLNEARDLDTSAARDTKGGRSHMMMMPYGFMSLINETNIAASQNAIGVNVLTGPNSLVHIGSFAPTSLNISSPQNILLSK